MMSNTSEIKSPIVLQKTMLCSVPVGVLALVMAWYFFPQSEVYSGILAGWFLAAINYVFLVRLIERLAMPQSKKLTLFLLLIFKMLFLLAVVGMSFWVLKVHALAFAAGYMVLMVAVIVQGLVKSVTDRES